MAPIEHKAVQVDGLGRRFALRWVLRGVSFDVEQGEIVGLFGANGSGKSTVLRVLATLLRPNAGSATIDGHDVARDANAVRSSVGYLAHVAGLYDDLTANENLLFTSDMLGVPRFRVAEVLARVGLEHVSGERARGFSAGMQRRLALARLLLARPRVLLLDEPYSNLDAEGVTLVNDVIREAVSSGGAALIVLHERAPATNLLNRTLTLVSGRIAGPAGGASPDRAAPVLPR
jgi:heme ABC exporter ATP-binding subunit CcmA